MPLVERHVERHVERQRGQLFTCRAKDDVCPSFDVRSVVCVQHGHSVSVSVSALRTPFAVQSLEM